MRKKPSLMLAVALAVLGSGIARSQPAPTSGPTPTSSLAANMLQSTYYSNAGDDSLPDGSVRIVNQSGASLCALVYVIDADQEIKECCGCPISQGGTDTLSVDNDLTSNPLNGVATVNGSISIISSAASSCDPGAPKPTGQLAAFGTHPQSGVSLTEEGFTMAPLSTAALSSLSAECEAIE